MAKKRFHETVSHKEYRAHYPSEEVLEKRDGYMIGNDESKFANLPTEVMMKAYPECPAYMDGYLDDSIHGVDKQLKGDNARRSGGFSPHKY